VTPALEVRDLHKVYGGLTVTNSVSLTVAPGERRLLIGPNGAGKTTLFNLITGDLRPTGGRILLFGTDITALAGRRRAHLGLARTYQIITLFPNETLRHNVMLALLGTSPRRWNPLRRFDIDPALLAAAEAVLDQVGLAHLALRQVRETAYGEQRRVEIALALAQRPRVLLLDEPFAGLSAQERRDVAGLIGAIPPAMTVVMIEHDMDAALDLADRITLLDFGLVVVEGTRAEVVADARTRAVYLGG
jgi:branched-chain amino acid transport system ATP-binding protein